jgi:hypothetical protein
MLALESARIPICWTRGAGKQVHFKEIDVADMGANKTRSNLTKSDAPVVSVGRHSTNCRICGHGKRAEIESDFVRWKSPARITTEYRLGNRASVYRHAHAIGLFEKRGRNLRAALERIIEQAGEVDVTAPAVVAAVQAYAKINAAGQWVDRTEHVNLNELFERMTVEELETYARDGVLPAWFAQTVGETPMHSQETENDR